jgi:hypothetical protein
LVGVGRSLLSGRRELELVLGSFGHVVGTKFRLVNRPVVETASELGLSSGRDRRRSGDLTLFSWFLQRIWHLWSCPISDQNSCSACINQASLAARCQAVLRTVLHCYGHAMGTKLDKSKVFPDRSAGNARGRRSDAGSRPLTADVQLAGNPYHRMSDRPCKTVAIRHFGLPGRSGRMHS